MAVQRKMLIICAREYQNSIDDSVHRLLSKLIGDMGLGHFFEIQNTVIRGKNGSEFVFKGIKQNINNLKSFEGADVCWVEEAATVSENSWRVLIPTIRKKDSEIWVSFNPENKSDPTYKRFVLNPPPNAWVRQVNWRDNPWFGDILRAEMEHDFAVDEEMAQHIWEGQIRRFAEGAVYKKQVLKAQREGRVGPVPIVEGVEVDTYWDLGKNDHTAIWFVQTVGLQKRAVDYYQDRLQDLPHYIKVLKYKSRTRGYNYGEHYLPHDVEHDLLGMPTTRKEQLEQGGVKPVRVVPRVRDLSEGVEMTRRLFDEVWFDDSRQDTLPESEFPEGFGQDGVPYGLDALSNYKLKYDENNDVHTRFIHDWSSNGADAFRQFAQTWRPQRYRTESDSGAPRTYRRGKMKRVVVPDVV